MVIKSPDKTRIIPNSDAVNFGCVIPVEVDWLSLLPYYCVTFWWSVFFQGIIYTFHLCGARVGVPTAWWNLCQFGNIDKNLSIIVLTCHEGTHNRDEQYKKYYDNKFDNLKRYSTLISSISAYKPRHCYIPRNQSNKYLVVVL